MIPSSRSLVTLQPARQAALQAIMTVENCMGPPHIAIFTLT